MRTLWQRELNKTITVAIVSGTNYIAIKDYTRFSQFIGAVRKLITIVERGGHGKR